MDDISDLTILKLADRVRELEAELAEYDSHAGKCVKCGTWTCGFCGMHNSKGEWHCEICHHSEHVCGATEENDGLKVELTICKQEREQFREMIGDILNIWEATETSPLEDLNRWIADARKALEGK